MWLRTVLDRLTPQTRAMVKVITACAFAIAVLIVCMRLASTGAHQRYQLQQIARDMKQDVRELGETTAKLMLEHAADNDR